MKTKTTLQFALFILILPLIIFPACQKQRATDGENFFWTPIDPVADSLMREYELVTRGIERVPNRIDTVESQLDSIAMASGNPQLKARALFVKAYNYKRRDECKKMVKALDSALRLTDQVKYPYDHARLILSGISRKNISLSAAYRDYQVALKALTEVNDSFYISNVYTMMGALGEEIKDEEKAVDMFTLARDWLPSRYEFPKYLTSFNILLSLYRQGKTEQWHPLLDSLSKSEFCRVGDVRGGLWLSILLYEKNGKISDLYDAYQCGSYNISPKWGKPWVASMLAEHYLKEGNRDSMLYFARIMRSTMNPRLKHYVDMLRVNGMVYEAEGKTDSAKMNDRELDLVMQKDADTEETVRLQNAEQQREIAEIDSEMERERKQSERKIWVITMSAVALTVIVIWLVVRHVRRRDLRERKALESTLEKNNRRVVAAEMKVAEKEKALSEIAKDIQAIKPDEPEVVSRILSTINVNRSGDADWEKFQLLFGEMHPDYADDLRREYPALTAGDVKLACLIFLGLETKQIARILSINPDSVKKNRQRLRAKLGLTPDQPLDLVLRDFERDRNKGK